METCAWTSRRKCALPRVGRSSGYPWATRQRPEKADSRRDPEAAHSSRSDEAFVGKWSTEFEKKHKVAGNSGDNEPNAEDDDDGKPDEGEKPDEDENAWPEYKETEERDDGDVFFVEVLLLSSIRAFCAGCACRCSRS